MMDYGVHHPDCKVRHPREGSVLSFEALSQGLQIADSERPLLVSCAWCGFRSELQLPKEVLLDLIGRNVVREQNVEVDTPVIAVRTAHYCVRAKFDVRNKENSADGFGYLGPT